MKRFSFLLLFVLYGCDAFSGPEETVPLSADSLVAHLNVLADDSMLGRDGGSPQELLAAQYLRDMFTAYGLQAGVTGYFQDFTFTVDNIPPVLSAAEAASAAVDGAGWDGVRAGTLVSGDNASVQQIEYSTQNVIGVINGRGKLADEWVIIGAHYDHIGYEQVDPDSVIVFNGADDNGSGTALLLELARYLRHYLNAGVARSLDRRSLMFIGFGAEEDGLLGSWHFVQRPPSTIARTDITSMVNLDMVGRMRSDRLYVTGVYTSGLWEPLLEDKNTEALDLVFPSSVSSGSDHFPFAQYRIPVLFFYTGSHDQYHRPEDDVELINTEGMVSIGNLVVDVVMDLLVREERPSWVN